MEHGATYADLFYSFGISHPGALTTHNYPNFLRDVRLPDGKHLDMGAVDILRDRERGVPRYNAFRRLFHMPAPATFEALTGGRTDIARELSEVYGGDIEQVDLLVGCLCEPLPKGFGVSDTAFRVFVLMASRRLNADPFLSSDFRPEIYTEPGLAWVNDTTISEEIPGDPGPGAVLPFDAALRALRERIADFDRWTGAFQPHFAYGTLTKAQYERAHAMHLANHLATITYDT